MVSVLVTGANRGIGLELVNQLVKRSNPPAVLITTCRQPHSATELQKIAAENTFVHVLQLDVDNLESYADLVSKVSSIVGDKGLNVIINNAGILLGEKGAKLEDIKAEHFVKTYLTNSIAPVFLVQALLPLIKKASSANSNQPMGVTRAAIFNMSSILGSVELNNGGYWSYRESKASLDQSSRSMAFELNPEGILVTALHPGWVQTDMGGKMATLTVEDSALGLLKVIYGASEAINDKLVQWDGKILPW